MSGLLVTLRAELFRVVRTRSVLLSALFLALLSAVRVFAVRVSDAAQRAQALAMGARPEDVVDRLTAEGGGWAPFVDGWRTGLSAATLLLVMHGARAIASDRERGVLRIALTRSSSRGATVLARAALAVPLVLGAFAITGVAAFATASSYYEFGPLVERGYEFFSSEELRAELTTSALAALPAMFAVYAFGLFVSSVAPGGASAVSAAVSVFLAFDLFKEELGDAQYWIFASFAPTFVDGSALSEMSGVARGYADAGFTAAVMDQSFVVPWPQALLLVLLSCVAVARRPM